jgi:hypothetical protein
MGFRRSRFGNTALDEALDNLSGMRTSAVVRLLTGAMKRK